LNLENAFFEEIQHYKDEIYREKIFKFSGGKQHEHEYKGNMKDLY